MLIFFSDVGDSAIKYKLAFFRPKPSKFLMFGLLPKSPIHTGLICVKKIPQPHGDLTPYLTYVCQSLCEYLTHELSKLVPVLSRSLTAQSPEGLQKCVLCTKFLHLERDKKI